MKPISLLGYNVFIGDIEFFANGAEGVINTLNPHSFVLARKDDVFRDALNSSDFILPDGIGIKYAALLLAGININKIAGADIHARILDALNKNKGSCFYLGSSNKTLSKICERMKDEYPMIKVGTYSPPFRETFSEEERSYMIQVVNDFKPDVLFVGMTAPKQEKWVYKNRSELNVPLICSIGAVFDFYAGTVKRPGKFWVAMGLEWLPRFLREPHRLWRRNLVSTPLFLGLVFIEKIKMLWKGRHIQ